MESGEQSPRHPSHPVPVAPVVSGLYVAISLSPGFATDGVGLMTVAQQGVGPGRSSCQVLRTTDGGATWTVSVPAERASFVCDRPMLAGLPGQVVASVIRANGMA